ncbi:MAG: GNAT family N-acetyltransferase [Alphaproteobacteria bacterium]|nr:GNAT family N-acetyltransferase [Alphaproteobacteria bacterium]
MREAQIREAQIKEALPKDAPAICKLRRKVWLATYPNAEYNITRDLLIKLFEFTASQTIQHYRDLIAGKAQGFTGDDANNNETQQNYAINCQVTEQIGDIGADEADIEKFWLMEQGKGINKQLIAYASANKRGNVLTTIYVDPYQQGKGIGQRLFAQVEEYLNATLSINLRVVSYNHQAIAFYQKRGFGKIGFQDVDIDKGQIFPSDMMSRPPNAIK